jgi:hypothetical protein
MNFYDVSLLVHETVRVTAQDEESAMEQAVDHACLNNTNCIEVEVEECCLVQESYTAYTSAMSSNYSFYVTDNSPTSRITLQNGYTTYC